MLRLGMLTVHAQIRIVQRSKFRRVLGLVLCDVGLVNPLKGIHEHLVHSRAEVSHEAHEEERNLKDVVLDEFDAVDDILVPC